MRDRAATRALLLGLLGLPFGIFALFAIWTGVRSLHRIWRANGDLTGETSAMLGVVAGLLGAAALVGGTAYWFLVS
jgi:hypothetical protein